jgi:hypothetical protein
MVNLVNPGGCGKKPETGGGLVKSGRAGKKREAGKKRSSSLVYGAPGCLDVRR